MKFAVFVALGFVAMAIATPLAPRVRRQNSSNCPDSSNLGGLLNQVGNLVTNLLGSLPLLRSLNVTGNGGLLDLTGLLFALGNVLTDLLGNGLNGPTEPLVNTLDDLISTVNKLLGGKQGNQMACKSSDRTTASDVGDVVGSVHLYPGVPNLLISVVNLLTGLLSALGQSSGAPVPGIRPIPNVG